MGLESKCMGGIDIDTLRQYTRHEASGKCYFCDNDKTHTMYVPSIHVLRARGARDDMRSYDVCHKCWGRVNRRSTLSHEELIRYIHTLESRGSVRGRLVGMGETVTIGDLKLKAPRALRAAIGEVTTVMVDGIRSEFDVQITPAGILITIE